MTIIDVTEKRAAMERASRRAQLRAKRFRKLHWPFPARHPPGFQDVEAFAAACQKLSEYWYNAMAFRATEKGRADPKWHPLRVARFLRDTVQHMRGVPPVYARRIVVHAIDQFIPF